jgi:hypothetical protein
LDFDISEDGHVVYFEDYRSSRSVPIKLSFDVKELALSALENKPSGLTPPNNNDPMLVPPASEWRNKRTPPILYDTPLEVTQGQGDSFRALALGPDNTALIGSSNFLRVVGYGKGQAKILCQTRIAAEAFRVNLTPDGTVAVAGHSDGTLRWYVVRSRGTDKACLLDHVLSVHINEVDWGANEWTWTAWRPSTGEFAADAKSKELVAWQTTGPDGQVVKVPFRKLLLQNN